MWKTVDKCGHPPAARTSAPGVGSGAGDRTPAKVLSLCILFAICYLRPVKTTPLTVRRCPEDVHQAIKKSAKANNRSLNGETLTWLQHQAGRQQTCTAKELANALRKFEKVTTSAERRQMAEKIEESRQRMNHEHLH